MHGVIKGCMIPADQIRPSGLGTCKHCERTFFYMVPRTGTSPTTCIDCNPRRMYTKGTKAQRRVYAAKWLAKQDPKYKADYERERRRRIREGTWHGPSTQGV